MSSIASAFVESHASGALAPLQREAVQAQLVPPRTQGPVQAELVSRAPKKLNATRARLAPHDDTDKVPIKSFIDDVQRKEKLRKVMKPSENEGESGNGLPENAMPLSKNDDDVNYRYGADKSRQCAQCVHFREPGACELVAGLIRRVDTCDKFEADTVTRAVLIGVGESDVSEAMTRQHFNHISRALYDVKDDTADHGHLVDNVAHNLAGQNKNFDIDRFKKAATTNPIPYSSLKGMKMSAGGYKAIADALARSQSSTGDNHRKVVGKIADALGPHANRDINGNSKFDREKFHHASGDREYKRDDHGKFAASESREFKRTTRGKFSTIHHGRDARRAGVQVAKTVVFATEVTPPGFERVVRGLKKSGNVDNPWAVAWSMKDKGIRPKTTEDTHAHYPGEFGSKPRAKGYSGYDDEPTDNVAKKDEKHDPVAVQKKRWAVRSQFRGYDEGEEGGPGSGRRPEGRSKFAPDAHDDEDSATAAFTRRETPEQRADRIANKPVDPATRSVMNRLFKSAINAGRREGVMGAMQDTSTIPGIGG